MKTKKQRGLESLLAGIAVAAIGSFTACSSTSEPSTSSGGTSGGSSGTSGSGQCANGRDPLCGCNLPAPQTKSYPFQGPADAGAADAGDAGAWTCEEECTTHHPNGNAERLESCSFLGDGAAKEVTCTYYVKCVGRRPAELGEPVLESTEACELLAETAKLEAASIDAFVRLARELAHHRAPSDLVAQAREAAADERRHTRAMHSLAVSFGADAAAPPEVRIRTRRVPSLAAVLIENATEGCVRETFGALMAHVQALRATDPSARSTMAQIAADESRHAALAWAIHEWGRTRMRPSERRRIERAQRLAVRRLLDEIERGPVEVDEPALGLVGAIEARALAAALEQHLWNDEVRPAA